MQLSEIQTIVVCGAGTMGSGIAQVAAQSGFRTIQYDLQPAMLEQSRQAIEKSLTMLAAKGKLTEAEREAILSRLLFTHRIEDCRGEVVIEAIVEKAEIKQALFAQLDTLNGPHTLLASNTSSLSITDLQSGVASPGRVAGMHFFNPAPVMKLVEIVKGKATDQVTVDTLTQLARRMGKTPVRCADAPGFIVNHVARPYYLEAMRLLQQGVADAETIDRVLEATGFRMGPFRLMDLIGMDVNYSVSVIVWEALGKPPRLEPSPVQRAKVEAGELGRKTGKGFYTYDNTAR